MTKKQMLLITAYRPNAKNIGGPTGLIWEIIQYLKRKNIEIDIEVKEISNNRFIRVLRRNGFYCFKHEGISDKYDYVMVYPDDLLFFLRKDDWKRVIVLGPDSPAFRDARVLRTKKNIVSRWIKYIMLLRSKYNEYRALSCVINYIVVGNTDARYMKMNILIKNNYNKKSKIIFLRHPVLSKVIGINKKEKSIIGKRFIFSITPQAQNNDFMIEVIRYLKVYLKKSNLNVVLLGEVTKWMYPLFKSVENCSVEYVSWIENYKDICILEEDVHCLPLLSGAGTKNRTLTAYASGLEIITTSIGAENIHWRGAKGIYITNRPKKFAELICKVNVDNISGMDIFESRRESLEKTKNEFYSTLDFVFK